MQRFIRSMLIFMMAIMLFSCKKNLSSDAMPVHIVKGQTYYTQFVIRYEKNAFPTTNYRHGASIPINTAVKLLDINSSEISIEYGSGQPLLVKNIEKHTGDDVFHAFDKLFARQPVNLAQFNSLERQQIDKGEVAVGMSKKAVLAAIGYPPITETANLNANSWVYWSTRFNRFIVNFKDNKVSDIVN